MIPDDKEVREKLTPKQWQVYSFRMSAQRPRPLRECAAQVGIALSTTTSYWKDIVKRLGCDPAKEAMEIAIAKAQENPELPQMPHVRPLSELRAVAPETLARKLEMAAEALLDAITPEKIAEARLKDLADGVRSLLSMRQLVRGEPTQILGVSQRATLQEMMPVFVKEAQRRGYSFEVDASGEMRTVKKVGPKVDG